MISIGIVQILSVLALSSRFDGLATWVSENEDTIHFQYSLCRVVLMVNTGGLGSLISDGSFSTRSVESF